MTVTAVAARIRECAVIEERMGLLTVLGCRGVEPRLIPHPASLTSAALICESENHEFGQRASPVAGPIEHWRKAPIPIRMLDVKGRRLAPSRSSSRHP